MSFLLRTVVISLLAAACAPPPATPQAATPPTDVSRAPASPPPEVPADDLSGRVVQSEPDDQHFDKGAAMAALASVSIAACGKNLHGHVAIVFEPSGSVQHAVVDDGPHVSTSAGECVAASYRNARVPPYQGNVVRVGKTF